MAVVQVVDHADVRDALRLQPLDDGDLVLRLAEPAAVVVEGQRAADLGGLVGQRLAAWPTAAATRRSCSAPVARSAPKSSSTQSWALTPCRLSTSRMIRDSRFSSPGPPRRRRARRRAA